MSFQIEAAKWGPLQNPLVVLFLSLLPLALLAWWLLRRKTPQTVTKPPDPGEE